MFKRNEGTVDRILRLALGAVLLPAGLLLLGALQGSVLGIVITVLGVIGLVTAITGFCLPYALFGFSTLESEKKQTTVSPNVH